MVKKFIFNPDLREELVKRINKKKAPEIQLSTTKFILDACCGGRSFWFNKNHPNVLYVDKRTALKGHIIQRNCQHEVNPDKIVDFTNMPFQSGSFKLVVWDPPHLLDLQDNSIMNKKYGSLSKESWQYELTEGFKECWRVLQDYGVLIFKWNESSINRSKVLKLFHQNPLFGHPLHSKNTTHWYCFMKIPNYGGRE